MKTLIYSLAVALLLTISYSQAQEQEYYWVQKDGYLELNKSTDLFASFKFSEDGKTLFTGHSIGYYREWDIATGNLLFEKEFEYNAILYFLDLVIDRKGNKFHFTRFRDPQTHIYDIKNDTILYQTPADDKISSYTPYLSILRESHNEQYIFCKLSLVFNHPQSVPRIIYFYFDKNDDDYNNLLKDKLFDVSPLSTYNIYDNQLNNIKDTTLNPLMHIHEKNIKFHRFSGDDKYLIHIDSLNIFRIYDLDNNLHTYQKLSMNSKHLNYAQIDFMPDSDYFFILRHFGNQKSSQLEFYTTRGFNHVSTFTFENNFQGNRIEIFGNITAVTSSNGNIRLYQTDDLFFADELDFVATDIRNYRNTDIKFKPISKNEYENYQWYFGDGTISSQKEPTHKYSVPGKYTVTLNVWNDVEDIKQIEKQEYIYVIEELKADFELSSNIGYFPLTIEFTNKSTGSDLQYIWNFGIQSGWSQEKNPIFTYNASGYFDILLIVRDSVRADTAYARIRALNPKIPDHTILAEETYRMKSSITLWSPSSRMYEEYSFANLGKFIDPDLYKDKETNMFIIASTSPYSFPLDYNITAYGVVFFANQLDSMGNQVNSIEQETSSPGLLSFGTHIVKRDTNQYLFHNINNSSYNMLWRIPNDFEYASIGREILGVMNLPNNQLFVASQFSDNTDNYLVLSKYEELNPSGIVATDTIKLGPKLSYGHISKIFKENDYTQMLFWHSLSNSTLNILMIDNDLNIIKSTNMKIDNTLKMLDVANFDSDKYAILFQEQKTDDELGVQYFDYKMLIIDNNFYINNRFDIPENTKRIILTFCDFNDKYFLASGSIDGTAAFFYINKSDGNIFEYQIPNRKGSLNKVILDGPNTFAGAMFASETGARLNNFIRIRLDSTILSVPQTPRIEPDVVLYPNPTSEEVNIQSDIRIIKAELSDPLGRAVKSDIPITHSINTDNPGESFYEINLTVKGVAPGMYFLKLTSIYGDITVKKVVVM